MAKTDHQRTAYGGLRETISFNRPDNQSRYAVEMDAAENLPPAGRFRVACYYATPQESYGLLCAGKAEYDDSRRLGRCSLVGGDCYPRIRPPYPLYRTSAQWQKGYTSRPKLLAYLLSTYGKGDRKGAIQRQLY